VRTPSSESRPLVLPTSIPELSLRELGADHAEAYHALVHENRGHLTAHGDDWDDLAATLEDLTAALTAEPDRPTRFGIWHGDVLVGRIDLLPVDPPRFGLSYWLDQRATGNGWCTAALVTLLAHSEGALHATDVYAGVTHGNERSVGVLLRAGFRRHTDFATYTRFHKALGTAPLESTLT
jgi:RimJ/RimL family protein N-acetyltransferase